MFTKEQTEKITQLCNDNNPEGLRDYLADLGYTKTGAACKCGEIYIKGLCPKCGSKLERGNSPF